MTLDEIGRLTAAVMRKVGIERSDALGKFIAENPHLRREEILSHAALFGRSPFPSIDGSPPVYRDRPFYSASKEDRAQFNDEIIERDDLI